MSRILYRYLVAKILTLLLVVMLTSTVVFAQDGGGELDLFQNSSRDMVIIAATGGAGLILGLSTLSFVEEPGDHLKNIVVGGALGVIIGVAIVAVNQADMSRDMYLENASHTPAPTLNRLSSLTKGGRLTRIRQAFAGSKGSLNPPLLFNYSLSF